LSIVVTPAQGERRYSCLGKVLKRYIELDGLDHERIAQRLELGSQARIAPRAPKTLLRLLEQIVGSRSVRHEYHEVMPEVRVSQDERHDANTERAANATVHKGSNIWR
jgi:hypothetical protein